jgi:hypothetical protein
MQPFLLIWYFLDAEEHKIISNRGLEILEEQKTKNDCIHDVSQRMFTKKDLQDAWIHGCIRTPKEYQYLNNFDAYFKAKHKS